MSNRITLKNYLPVIQKFLQSPEMVDKLAAQGLKLGVNALASAYGEPGPSPFVPSGSLSPVSDALAAARAEIKQLKFLLASAPMPDAPKEPMTARVWLRTVSTPFAYIHPKTLAAITHESARRQFIIFPGSATKWVLTSLMPEGRGIFSPRAIPGIEKILAQ